MLQDAQGNIRIQAHTAGNSTGQAGEVRIGVLCIHGNVVARQSSFHNDILAFQNNVHRGSQNAVDEDVFCHQLQICHEELFAIGSALEGQILGDDGCALDHIVVEDFVCHIGPVVTVFTLYPVAVIFSDNSGGLTGKVIGEVFHSGSHGTVYQNTGVDGQIQIGAIRLVFRDQFHGTVAEGMTGNLICIIGLQTTGEVETVVAFAAVDVNALHILGCGHIHIHHIITAAGVDLGAAAFIGCSSSGLCKNVFISGHITLDLRCLLHVDGVSAGTGVYSNVCIVAVGRYRYSICQDCTIVSNFCIFHHNVLTLGQVQTCHDHVDVGNDDVAGHDGLALGFGGNAALVDQIITGGLGIGIICQDVQSQTVNIRSVNSDIAVVFAGRHTDGNGLGIIGCLGQSFRHCFLNRIIRLRHSGSDQSIAVSYDGLIPDFRNQAFCRYGDRLHGLSDICSGLFRIQITGDNCTGGNGISILIFGIEGFRKGNRGGIIFKFRLHRRQTACTSSGFGIRIQLVGGLACFLNFYDLGTARRRCQRCGNIHIIRKLTRTVFRFAVSCITACRGFRCKQGTSVSLFCCRLGTSATLFCRRLGASAAGLR